MAGKVRHLLNRDGRYFARLVIPKDLRRFLDGKAELRTPLGADYRSALRLLPGAVSELQHRIAIAERNAAGEAGRAVIPNRYPLSPDQLAYRNYHDRLALDDYFRDSDSRYASFGYVDVEMAQMMLEGTAGKLTDDQLSGLVGERIARYRHLGNTAVEFGTTEWRTVARAPSAFRSMRHWRAWPNATMAYLTAPQHTL